MTDTQARAFESELLAERQGVCEQLAALGLKQERRALRLIPGALAIERECDGQWRLMFDLPAGTFATSVLRELCHWQLPPVAARSE